MTVCCACKSPLLSFSGRPAEFTDYITLEAAELQPGTVTVKALSRCGNKKHFDWGQNKRNLNGDCVPRPFPLLPPFPSMSLAASSSLPNSAELLRAID